MYGSVAEDSYQQSAINYFKITRDGDTVLTGNFSGADTVVIDTTTQPERSYTYKAYRFVNGQVSDTSQPFQVTTLDTTTNNFTWQTYTFGGNAGGCLLNDVAIINDTDIWAVGDVPMKDSSANGYSEYNLVGWDGKQWSLHALRSYIFCGQSAMSSSYASAVAPWSPTNMWIATNGEIVPWNGTSQSGPICVETPAGFNINRMWGTDSNDVFAVGYAGNLTSYVGGVWYQIASGTTLNIRDIWGVSNSVSGQEEILAVASDEFTNDGVAVLQLSGTQSTMLQTAGLPTTSIVGVWSANGKEWYVCGDGLYMTRDLTQTWQKIKSVPPIQMEAVRGTGPNDIYVVGDFGLVLHWNGEYWFDCTGNGLPYIEGSYLAVAANGNTVVAVGYSRGSPTNQPAVALIGKRN